MDLRKIKMLPKLITSADNLEEEFRELFNTKEAKEIKGLVYFFMSQKAVPRVKGKSNILYIGKTKQTLRQRYLRYSAKLASGGNGKFYKNIIDNYEGLSIGYLASDAPRDLELKYFKKYYEAHLEYPPKSKVG